jgi:hypothetical protein
MKPSATPPILALQQPPLQFRVSGRPRGFLELQRTSHLGHEFQYQTIWIIEA